MHVMRSFFRYSVLALSSVMLLGVAGCGGGNESEIADQVAKSTPTAPTEPPPKSQAEYFQRQKQMNPYKRASGYPGARK
jgi:hypothetical protein